MGEARTKLSRMRKLIGDNLVKSVQEIPQASGFMCVELTELLALQARLREEGHKVSETVFLIKAVEVALRDFPGLNARQEGDECIVYDSINPGIAVNTPNGLIIVVLHDVQNKPLLTIAEEFQELLHKVRDNNLTMDDLSGGTLTISSQSKSKMRFFTSIVNNNECLILGIGGIHKEACVMEDGSIQARDVFNLSININHTLTDGVPSTSFLEKVCHILEHPAEYMN